MGFDDTGLCIPETRETLLIQQSQLLRGIRNVQMFPIGTAELPLPVGLKRFKNSRGVYHYAPDRISGLDLMMKITCDQENELLNLGPFNKSEVAERILAGETLLCVTEHTPDNIEVRSAAGTDKTIDTQREYFERTKEPNNTITIGALSRVLEGRTDGLA